MTSLWLVQLDIRVGFLLFATSISFRATGPLIRVTDIMLSLLSRATRDGAPANPQEYRLDLARAAILVDLEPASVSTVTVGLLFVFAK